MEPHEDMSDVASAAQALAALTEMTKIGGALWGTPEGDQIKRRLPLLRRKLCVAVNRASDPNPLH